MRLHLVLGWPRLTAMMCLLATTGTQAQQAAVSDFRQFAGQWRLAEHRDCKESLKTNISIRPLTITYQYGDIGTVLCDVRKIRPFRQQGRQKGLSYECHYTFADGIHDAEAAFLFPLERDKIELSSKGGLNGVYVRCPASREY